jgi:hypothetical protein
MWFNDLLHYTSPFNAAFVEIEHAIELASYRCAPKTAPAPSDCCTSMALQFMMLDQPRL